MGPFLLFSMLPKAMGQEYLVAPELAIVTVVLFPISVAGALLSREFLGIRRFLRRSLVAFGAWIGLFSLYALGVNLARGVMPDAGDGLGVVAHSAVLTVAIVGATFHPAQDRLRRFLERRLFPDTYDVDKEFHSVADEIVGLTDVDQMASLLLERLSRALCLSWATITVYDEALGSLRYDWGVQPDRLQAPPDTESRFSDLPEFISVNSEFDAVAIPLVANGTRMGIVMLGAKVEEAEPLSADVKFLQLLMPLAATALENGLLVRRLEVQMKALADRERALRALSRRLIDAAEDERRRVALDLHDDPLQRAILLSQEMREAPATVGVADWIRQIDEIGVSLRATCQHLRPAALDELGLVGAMERLVSDSRARTEAEVALLVQDDQQWVFDSLDPALKVAVYRVTQEALSNCHRHADATHILVKLAVLENRLLLEVIDNGRGYEERPSSTSDLNLGILGMRERLRPWNGVLRIERRATGGTVLTAEVVLDPVAEEMANAEAC